MEMKKNRRINIPMRIASILLCLVLFSVYMTSGMLAKYTTGGSAKDQGRVAKFSVSATADNANYEFKQGEETPIKEYKVKVENPSEVAVRYTVQLQFDEAVPDYLVIKRGTEETEELLKPATFDGKIVELQGGTLAPKGTGTDTISFSIDYNKFVQSNSGHEVTLDFSAAVKFIQID